MNGIRYLLICLFPQTVIAYYLFTLTFDTDFIPHIIVSINFPDSSYI